jgi:hypothetical protein
MDPLKVSAQFAAFIWFANNKQQHSKAPEAAVRFARENWSAFLPLAHQGLGRLLLKIADRPAAATAHIHQRMTGGTARQQLAPTG